MKRWILSLLLSLTLTPMSAMGSMQEDPRLLDDEQTYEIADQVIFGDFSTFIELKLHNKLAVLGALSEIVTEEEFNAILDHYKAIASEESELVESETEESKPLFTDEYDSAPPVGDADYVQFPINPWHPIRGYPFGRWVGGRGYHLGDDCVRSGGTPIYAIYDGYVKYARYNRGGWGYLMIVESHLNNLVSNTQAGAAAIVTRQEDGRIPLTSSTAISHISTGPRFARISARSITYMIQSTNSKSHILLRRMILILTLIFGVAIVVYIYRKPLYQNHNETELETSLTLHYVSKEKEIEFMYPSHFGHVVEETLMPGSNRSLVSKGEGLRITFSNNINITILLATPDFETFKETAYHGEDFTELCPDQLTIDENGNSCQHQKISDHMALLRTEFIVDEGVYNLVRTFSIPMSESRYGGMLVTQNFPEIYDALNRDITDQEQKNDVQEYAKQLLKKVPRDDHIDTSIMEIDDLIQSLVLKN